MHAREPVAVEAESMHTLIEWLGTCFDLSRCADRLGRDATTGLPMLNFPAPHLLSDADVTDLLISLFLANRDIATKTAREAFPSEHLDVLERMQLLRADHERRLVRSPFCLFPCEGVFIATDAIAGQPGINQVMCLFPESYMLAGVVPRVGVSRTLDLCTGSGIHAIVAAQHSSSVVGVDINPRAITFSRFNAALNQASNVRFFAGDLYEPVRNEQFDLVLANPPYNPSLESPAGANFWSGGASGEELLRRIIAGLDDVLTELGMCHIVTLLVFARGGPSYKAKLGEWLGGKLGAFDVIVNASPYDEYLSFDPASAHHQYLVKTFERFEFGVISLRRRRSPRQAIYYHGPPLFRAPLFDERIRCQGRVDDEMFEAARCLSAVRGERT